MSAKNNSSTTQSTSNNSTANLRYQPYKEAVEELVPFSVAIIVANSLVFVLFLKKKTLRTSANYLLLSLALCDFFTGSVNIPLTIMAFTQAVPIPKLPDLFFFVTLLHNFTAVATGYHIVVITLEQYLVFVWGVRRPISIKVILKALAGVWGASAIIAIVPFFWKSELHARSPKASNLQTAHALFCLVAVFLLPYTFMIYAYAVMFKAITKKRQQLESLSDNSARDDNQGSSRQEKRCLAIFVTMVTLYLVCWMPWFTLALILTLDTSGSYHTFSHVFVVIRYMTSVFNPVLYTFFKRDFFTGFKQVILRRTYLERRMSFSAEETARNSSEHGL